LFVVKKFSPKHVVLAEMGFALPLKALAARV
jgi:hypothetical protein